MSSIAKVPPNPILNATTTAGLLNVGPGSNPPTTPPDPTKGNVAGVWGYVGPLIEIPNQTSQPPITCAVYGEGGVVGVNGYSGTVADTAPDGDGVVGFGGSSGVHGFGAPGHGVHGVNSAGSGVTPNLGCGVFGETNNGYGVYGASSQVGVYGICSADKYAIWGVSTNGSGVRGDTQDGTAGVIGTSTGKGLAGRFDGPVNVNGALNVSGNLSISGDITGVNTITVLTDVILKGGDCAEQFDIQDAATAEPGTVLVIDDEGKLRESQGAYDKRVAGVVSGAGEYRPALVLDRKESTEGRASVALVGKVYCKVDADAGPIAVGDLLTTSERPGFGMKAGDSTRAFGAVIGKALRPLRSGQGMIPILVALQ
jgi:hypothetical protein